MLITLKNNSFFSQQGQVEMVHKKVEKPQHILQKVLSNQTGEALMVTTPAPVVSTSEASSVGNVSSSIAVEAVVNNQQQASSDSSTQQPQPQLVSLPPTSSSMIKSLLANKVMTNSSGTAEASQVASTNQHHQQFDAASKLIKSNVNVHQVTPFVTIFFRLTSIDKTIILLMFFVFLKY